MIRAKYEELYDIYILKRLWNTMYDVEYNRLTKTVEELRLEGGYKEDITFDNPYEEGKIRLIINEIGYGSLVKGDVVYPKELLVSYWVHGEKRGITITTSDIELMVEDFGKEYGEQYANLFNVYKEEDLNLDIKLDKVIREIEKYKR